MKNIIKKSFQAVGLQVNRYKNADVKLAQEIGLNLQTIDYKDFQILKGISSFARLSFNEARFLASLVRKANKTNPIIEIGTLFGFSAMIIALNKDTGQKLITVDNYSWNPYRISPAAHKKATHAALSDAVIHHNVEIISEEKDYFYQNYKGASPALFFCDANHEYEPTLHDLNWARSVGAEIICGHDYRDKFPGVKRAVDELGGPSELVDSLFLL